MSELSALSLVDPVWMRVALKEVGEKEVSGAEDNPRIVQYHSETGIKQRSFCDEVPWCASFVNWCLKQAGVKGTKSALARSFLNYGFQCEYHPGCIVVLKRSNDVNKGHVGFAIDKKLGFVKVLGGNQDNAVNAKWFPVTSVLDYRWPNGV